MQTNELPGILSDRQIRALCEVPVAEIEFQDLRTRGVSNSIVLPIYANEFRAITHPIEGRRDPHLLKLAKVYGGEKGTEDGPGIGAIRMYDKDWVKEQQANFKPMIEPFFPHQVKTRNVIHNATDGSENDRYETEKIVSLGLSSYGYDVTCGNEFKIFTNVNSAIVDPKNFDSNSFVDVVTTDEKPYIIIPPNSFALARTKEYFRIPRNVLTVCLGKSTYARCGIIVNVTPFEPEWEGYVTLEFSNTTPLPAKIYANEGCAQVLFFRGSEPCEVSYKDRSGKYQGQEGLPVPPKV
jgi:dCTP deaminase